MFIDSKVRPICFNTESDDYKTTFVNLIILIQSTINSDNDHNESGKSLRACLICVLNNDQSYLLNRSTVFGEISDLMHSYNSLQPTNIKSVLTDQNGKKVINKQIIYLWAK